MPWSSAGEREGVDLKLEVFERVGKAEVDAGKEMGKPIERSGCAKLSVRRPGLSGDPREPAFALEVFGPKWLPGTSVGSIPIFPGAPLGACGQSDGGLRSLLPIPGKSHGVWIVGMTGERHNGGRTLGGKGSTCGKPKAGAAPSWLQRLLEASLGLVDSRERRRAA